MGDEFFGTDTPISPARNLVAVTPHNTNELAVVPKALYIGVTGDVSIIAADDSAAVVLKAVPAGAIIPVRARIVKSTGTTATDIVALY